MKVEKKGTKVEEIFLIKINMYLIGYGYCCLLREMLNSEYSTLGLRNFSHVLRFSSPK